MGPYTSLPASIPSITSSSPFQKLTEFCCDCTSLYSHQQCTRWRVFKKLKIELPYDPAVPFLDIYCPKSSLIQKYICTPMFIAALFTIAKIWKQPVCPSTDEWIKKIWYTHTHNGILLTHFKKEWKFSTCTNMERWRQMNLEGIVLSEVSQTEKDKYSMILLICRT